MLSILEESNAAITSLQSRVKVLEDALRMGISALRATYGESIEKWPWPEYQAMEAALVPSEPQNESSNL